MADEREPTLNRAPQVTFSYHDVQPPTPLYIGRDDTLVAWGATSVASNGLQIDARILTPDGEIRPSSFQFAFANDRVAHAISFDLVEGFLLSLTVGTLTSPVRRGELFAQLWLARGGLPNSFVFDQLLAAYVTSNVQIGWPPGLYESSLSGHGKMRHIVGTDPAAGVEISETCPTNTRWRLIGFNYTLVTSAVAGNRISQLFIDDATNAGVRGLPAATQAASLTNSYQYGAFGAQPATLGTLQIGILPPDVYVSAGGRIRTVTTALDAGDNYSAPVYCVEEWLDV
jgi:hypothetical protein